MARRRASGARDPDGLSREDWLHVGRVAAAIAVVGGTVLVGALLSVGRDGGASDGAAPTVIVAAPSIEPSVDPPTETTDATPVAPPAETVTLPQVDRPAERAGAGEQETLQTRMAADARRLAGKDDEWTLQLMAACDPVNVERVVDSLGGDRRLLVLPASIGGRDCFRVCWGPYDSRAAAEAGRSRLPSAAGTLGPSPQPRPVSDVL